MTRPHDRNKTAAWLVATVAWLIATVAGPIVTVGCMAICGGRMANSDSRMANSDGRAGQHGRPAKPLLVAALPKTMALYAPTLRAIRPIWPCGLGLKKKHNNRKGFI